MSYKNLQKIGVTDEITTCSCCARENLKRTVVMEDLENQEFYFFGSDCATKVLGGSAKAKKILKTPSNEVKFISFNNGYEVSLELACGCVQNARRKVDGKWEDLYCSVLRNWINDTQENIEYLQYL